MIITRTPFRISFFGGGTDYPVWYEKNGGAVLATSINKYCYVTCRFLPPFFNFNYRVRYREQEETQHISEIKHPSARECLFFANIDKGIELQHNTDVPGRSGLGSSSAFTVGLLHALYALQKKEVTKYQLATDAIHVEQDRIKENVGAQDQTTSAFGGINKIEFGGEKKIHVMPLSLDVATIRALESHLILFNTGQARVASEIALEQIRNTSAKEKEMWRMRAMVDEAEKILTANPVRFSDFGALLDESWQIKRTLSTKITNLFIDDVYARARAHGAWGGKLLGAGGGGFILIFAPAELHGKIKTAVGLPHVPFTFEQEGSKVIFEMPADSVEV